MPPTLTAPTMPADLKALAGELEEKRGALGAIFQKYTSATGLAIPDDQVEEVNRRNDELTELGKSFSQKRKNFDMQVQNYNELEKLTKGENHVPFGAHDAPLHDRERVEAHTESMGKQFLASNAYKQIAGSKGPAAELPIDLKSVLTTDAGTAGYPPQVLRSGVLIYTPQARPTLIDMVPISETTQNAYKYMLETLYTNAAVETAEGSLYPESALQYQEEIVNIRKIAVFIPVTDEQLADEPDVRSIIDQRLTLMVKQRLNTQIVSGSGTSVNLTGLLNVSGIQTQALGSDSRPDAVYKAMGKLMTIAFTEPSSVWFNPIDWQSIRLTKTTYGTYLWGSPDSAGPDRIWGLPIAQHVGIPQGTGIVGDFAGFTRLIYRKGIEFEVSNSHSDFFQRGQLAIRCQLRAAWVVYRPQAVCTVTGL